MKILPYKIEKTNDKLTSRAGLLAVAELMEKLRLSERINRLFPPPQSNRGFKPASFVQTIILMQHEGSFHLDDVRHLQEDDALKTVLNFTQMPQASSLGAWLRRMGNDPESFAALRELNKYLLSATPHAHKGVTLDIDATEIVAQKADAKWTYNKNPGYMPMVGHIAETGQIVACDFREGNASPSKENLEFILQCQQSLPEEFFIKNLRIDAAGYQTKIIQHCDEHKIGYAIRAKMCKSIRETIQNATESNWQPLLNKNGEPTPHQDTMKTVHCIGDYANAFTLIVQRTRIQGQTEFDLNHSEESEEIATGEYRYRALATNRQDLTDSQIVHWYNQRGEDSENRIKELKLDFGGSVLPCSDFQANALYFSLSALSYNVFTLLRELLPESLSHHRVVTIRWRLYAMAAKVVTTGRRIFVKLQFKNQTLLEHVLTALKKFEPHPV